MTTYENCGYCRECIRLKKLRLAGCKPTEALECAYKHILQVYNNFDPARPVETSSSSKEDSSRSPVGSCGADCRWISLSGSSTKTCDESYDYYSGYAYDLNHTRRKRIKFSKRRSLPK